MPKAFDNRYIFKILLFLVEGILYNESFLKKKSHQLQDRFPSPSLCWHDMLSHKALKRPHLVKLEIAQEIWGLWEVLEE